jgi:hypothetical protein
MAVLIRATMRDGFDPIIFCILRFGGGIYNLFSFYNIFFQLYINIKNPQ